MAQGDRLTFLCKMRFLAVDDRRDWRAPRPGISTFHGRFDGCEDQLTSVAALGINCTQG